MKMKHLFFLICSLVCSLFFCACNEESCKMRIGVSIPAPTHGWASGVVWNAEKYAEELRAQGYEVMVVTAKDSAAQVSGIENMLMKGVDALVVMSQDPVPLLNVCKRAKKQGAYLVVVSNPLSEPVHDVFVNGDNRSFGIEAARAIGAELKDGGSIIVLRGNPCPIDNDRVNGFTETLKAEFPAINIMDIGETHWSTEKGQSVMELFLQKHAKIDAVWAGDDDVLAGALKAYEKSGRKEIRAFVGGGGAQSVVKRLVDRDPLVRATVTYSPDMINKGIEAAVKAGKKEKTPEEIIIPSRIITEKNAADFVREGSPY